MFKETLILCVGILFHQEMTNIWVYKENWKKKKLSTINVKYCVRTWNTVSPNYFVPNHQSGGLALDEILKNASYYDEYI
jgi:hypothetical protein